MKRSRASSVVKGTLAGSENKLPKLSHVTKDLCTINKERREIDHNFVTARKLAIRRQSKDHAQ